MVAAAASMAFARELRAELGQFAILNHLQVLADRSFHSSVDGDTFGEQLIEGSKAYSGHNDAIHLAASQGLEGLAHSMGVMLVSIFHFFQLHGIQVNNDEPGGGPEMTINLAFHSLKTFRWNTDFHDV